MRRYVREAETVRTALGLGPVHLMGHSWGGWLSIEYALIYPGAVKSLILNSTVTHIPQLRGELERLRSALGSETVAMMQRYEAAGTFDHPEYQGAITVLNYRHVCRLSYWPAPIKRSVADWNTGPYGTMQGPNEFLYIGNLRDWSRVHDHYRIAVPVLITVGQHDEQTATCAMRIRLALPQSEPHVLSNSSHMPFYEEPEVYYPVLRDFLKRNSGEKSNGRGA